MAPGGEVRVAAAPVGEGILGPRLGPLIAGGVEAAGTVAASAADLLCKRRNENWFRFGLLGMKPHAAPLLK